MNTALTILLRDQDDEPVPGVAVVLLTPPSYAVRALEQTSDVDGRVSGLVPEGTYEVRAYLPNSRISPFFLEVVGPTQTMTADIDIRMVPSSTDPLLCTVYETFRGARGPADGRVFAEYIDSVYVASSRIQLPGDAGIPLESNSFAAEFQRGARVAFGLPGSHVRVEALIPDQPSVRLTDLIFPYPREILADFTNPVAAGVDVEIPTIFLMSDGSRAILPLVSGQWVTPHGLRLWVTDAGLTVNASPGTYDIEFLWDNPPPYFPQRPSVYRPPVDPPLLLQIQVT